MLNVLMIENDDKLINGHGYYYDGRIHVVLIDKFNQMLLVVRSVKTLSATTDDLAL